MCTTVLEYMLFFSKEIMFLSTAVFVYMHSSKRVHVFPLLKDWKILCSKKVIVENTHAPKIMLLGKNVLWLRKSMLLWRVSFRRYFLLSLKFSFIYNITVSATKIENIVFKSQIMKHPAMVTCKNEFHGKPQKLILLRTTRSWTFWLMCGFFIF